MSKDEDPQHENIGSDDFTDRELQDAHGSERGRDSLFLPFFLSLVACAWLTWGGIELAADANSFSLHPDREMTPEELAAREARAKAKMAERLYVTYCGTCH